MPHALHDLLKLTGADTPVHPASSVKSSWPAIVRDAARHGEVVVTHHNRPEVVVVDVATYADLVRRAEANDPLKALAAAFDRRLELLDTAEAGAALRAAAAAGLPRGGVTALPVRNRPKAAPRAGKSGAG